jgi:membrane-associated phospholipid phosphatase
MSFGRKYLIAWTVALTGVVSYLAVGYASVHAARVIGPGLVDRWVPFLPWTVWIYVLVYAAAFHIGIDFIETHDTLIRTILSLAISWAIAYVVFVVWPIDCPRVPVTEANDWTLRLMRAVQIVDPPNNTLPSLHVSNLLCLGLGCYRDRRARGLLMLAVSLFPMLSTLTTKQHYFVDVVSGIALAGVCHLAAFAPYPRAAAQAALKPGALPAAVDEVVS